MSLSKRAPSHPRRKAIAVVRASASFLISERTSAVSSMSVRPRSAMMESSTASVMRDHVEGVLKVLHVGLCAGKLSLGAVIVALQSFVNGETDVLLFLKMVGGGL